MCAYNCRVSFDVRTITLLYRYILILFGCNSKIRRYFESFECTGCRELRGSSKRAVQTTYKYRFKYTDAGSNRTETNERNKLLHSGSEITVTNLSSIEFGVSAHSGFASNRKAIPAKLYL